jgi:hypothetical protein
VRMIRLNSFLSIFSTTVLVFTMCLPPSLVAQRKSSTAGRSIPTVRVPFVGCEADGQVGPLKAPKGHSKTVAISPDAAQRLAYYKGEQGPGVLAPRGWNCFEAYGSNGNTLYVSPDPINSAIFFSDHWQGFSGPAIQLSFSVGDTSGRFEVAQIIARVFPAHRKFVRDVIAENIEPASDFPFGPYPKDTLTYKGKNLVEYETPAETDGLGPRSRLQKNADPIRGVEILSGEELDLIHLHVRLSSDRVDLASTIIQQVEREAATQ